MAKENRATLKTYFETGDFPTQQEFANLIDSNLNTTDDDTTDIIEGTDKKFVSDAEKVVIGNTSGSNTGDQDLSTLATKANVLELDNTGVFTPDADYEPATKKYVDDNGGGGTAAGTTYDPSGETGGNVDADKTNVQTGLKEVRDWVNDPTKAPIDFTGAMVFNKQLQYNDYVQTGALELTATSVKPYMFQVVRITADGVNDITFGAGIDKVITQFVNPLPAGDYWFYMASFVSPGGIGAGVHVSIPDVQSVIITQLTALTLGAPTIGDSLITVPFINPNSTSEDQNQLYYKLNTEPTTWTTGVVAATGAVTFPAQTGLTNDLLYDFKAVAEGSLLFSNSEDSNEVSATPGAKLPVAQYLADNNALDTSGNGYDGTATAITYGDDRSSNPNSAFVLDGVTSFIDIDVALAGLSANTIGTLSVWIKPVLGAPASTSIMLSFGDYSEANYFYMYQGTTGIVAFAYNRASTYAYGVTTDSIVLADGTWTHVAFVQDGISPILYIDGVAVAQTITGTLADKDKWFAGNPLIDNGRIGDRNWQAPPEKNFFAGSIDDIRIYDTNLSADEILGLYNE